MDSKHLTGSFDWFMEKYMKYCPVETRTFDSVLAKWVLENNYVEFEVVKNHQRIVTAMGTIFSVMVATFSCCG